MDPTVFVHPTAIVDEGASIGEGSKIWHFSHVMTGARIGARVMLGQGCFVGRGVRIGDGARLQNHVSVFEGVDIGEDVFCGPSVVFTNVVNPRAHVRRHDAFRPTRVRRGATLGANATILPGIEIDRYAFVGAGATVTRDVAAYVLVMGVPARPAGFVSRRGCKLDFRDGRAVCAETGEVYELCDGRVSVVSEAR